MAVLEKVAPVAHGGEQRVESIAPISNEAQLDPLAQLDATVALAIQAEAKKREKLAGEINLWMKAARERVGGRRVADELLGLLHSKKLEGLMGPDGRDCRSVAVEQLLQLGFPFALEVMPEDLEHHREQERSVAPLGKLALLLAGLAGLLMPAVQLYLNFLWWFHPAAWLPLGLGLVSFISAARLTSAKPTSKHAKLLRNVLYGSGLAGLLLAVFSSVPNSQWSYVAAVLPAAAAFAVSPKSQDGSD